MIAEGNNSIWSFLLSVNFREIAQICCLGVKWTKTAFGVYIVQFDELFVETNIWIFFAKNTACFKLFSNLVGSAFFNEFNKPREGVDIFVQYFEPSFRDLNIFKHHLWNFGIFFIEIASHKSRYYLSIGNIYEVESEVKRHGNSLIKLFLFYHWKHDHFTDNCVECITRYV